MKYKFLYPASTGPAEKALMALTARHCLTYEMVPRPLFRQVWDQQGGGPLSGTTTSHTTTGDGAVSPL